jgi:hypothetical protein
VILKKRERERVGVKENRGSAGGHYFNLQQLPHYMSRIGNWGAVGDIATIDFSSWQQFNV